jgi:DNA repair exonuclease SbcCD ATPase subunit
MEQTHLALSELIKRIHEYFPNETDLKGFAGISKSVIVNSLTETLALTTALKDYDNELETILLKREVPDKLEKINRHLDEPFEKLSPENFNSFLKLISKIRYLIRETFLAVANEPIRTEAEIIASKEELGRLTNNLKELKSGAAEALGLKESLVKEIIASHKEVNDLKGQAAEIVSDLDTKKKIFEESEKKVEAFLTSSAEHNDEIANRAKNTTMWETEIKKAKDDLGVKLSEYDELIAQIKKSRLDIDDGRLKIFGKTNEDGKEVKGYIHNIEEVKERIKTFLEDQEKKFKAQFDQIESLLPGATSAGLAEAFQKQKESYKWPVLIWSGIFIVVMAFMTGCSVYLFYHQFLANSGKNGSGDLTSALISILNDLPFFIPTIWLAVFASKQQSQYKRLQQEYAFKEINAKSFHGHKKQIEELMNQGHSDAELLSKLIVQLVAITSQNPSETLDSNAHNDSPPLFKLIDGFIPKFKRKVIAEASQTTPD